LAQRPTSSSIATTIVGAMSLIMLDRKSGTISLRCEYHCASSAVSRPAENGEGSAFESDPCNGLSHSPGGPGGLRQDRSQQRRHRMEGRVRTIGSSK
jgi:hypothetical protein